MPRVTFGRINRRQGSDAAFDLRPFREDMLRLVERAETRGAYAGFEWIAADLRVDPSGTFVAGVLGYMDQETLTTLDETSFSWLKGETRKEIGATNRTMVPFAIDLREERRWIGFVTTPSIRHQRFRSAFTSVLNVAAARAGLMPAEWDVDLVTGIETITDWVRAHPEICRMRRIVKFPNPNVGFDKEREQMRQLAASKKEEVYIPARGGNLDLADNPVLPSYLEGVELGNVEIQLQARAGPTGTVRFSTADRFDFYLIEGFGDDLESGMQRVQDAVHHFSMQRAGEKEPGQEGFDL